MKIFLLFFISSYLFAADNIRLDREPYPGVNLKVHNQKKSSLCYAYTAAYLIDYERQANEKERSSELILAINYKSSLLFSNDNNPDYGNACEVIDKVKNVYKKKFDNDLVEEEKYYELLGQLQYLYSKHSEHFENLDNSSEKMKLPLDLINCSVFNVILEKFGIDKSLNDIKNLLLSPRFIDFLSKSITPEKDKIKIDVKTTKAGLAYFSQSTDAIISKIEDALDKRKPSSITYCGNVLTKGKLFQGLEKGLFGLHKNNNCESHLGVVVGKRIINGTVQYLIQDSYGSDHDDKYHNDIKFEESGKFWIDKEVLAKNLTYACYINH